MFVQFGKTDAGDISSFGDADPDAEVLQLHVRVDVHSILVDPVAPLKQLLVEQIELDKASRLSVHRHSKSIAVSRFHSHVSFFFNTC